MHVSKGRPKKDATKSQGENEQTIKIFVYKNCMVIIKENHTIRLDGVACFLLLPHRSVSDWK